LVVPYFTYVVAESVHASGVLAVVAAGVVRGRYSQEIVSSEMRILARSVWNIFVFMLNTLIFMLIGLQMSDMLEKLARYSLAELVGWGLFVSAVAITVRFAWVYPVAYLPRWLSGSLREGDANFRKRELGIMSWCGMRGIVSLAAALALPMTLPNGAPFPQRDLIIFLTFFVIAVTLVGQGLTLPALIRKLKVGSSWSLKDEQQRVRAAMSAVALAAIEEMLAAEGAPTEWADQLRAVIVDRIALLAPDGTDATPRAELLARLRRAAIQAERRELIRLWRENEISNEVMHHLEEILDYQEAHL
jgi:CPA1 family monovalent cation:H+ antiporter